MIERENSKSSSVSLLSEQLDRSRDCHNFDGSVKNLKDANVPFHGLVKKIVNVDDLLQSDSDGGSECDHGDHFLPLEEPPEHLVSMSDRTIASPGFDGTTTQVLHHLANDAGKSFNGLIEKMLNVDEYLSDTDDEEEEEDFLAFAQELIDNKNNEQQQQQQQQEANFTMLSFLEESFQRRRSSDSQVDDLANVLKRVLDIDEEEDDYDDESSEQQEEGVNLEDVLQNESTDLKNVAPISWSSSSLHSKKGLENSISSNSLTTLSRHDNKRAALSNAAA